MTKAAGGAALAVGLAACGAATQTAAPPSAAAGKVVFQREMKAALRTIAGSAQGMGYNIDVVTPFKWIDAYRDGLNDILSGKLSPREWAGRLQQEWDVARREGRIPRA